MKVPVNISNDALVEEIIKHNLIKPEEIERDGKKMIKPTRFEAIEMLDKVPELPGDNSGDNNGNGTQNKPEYTIYYDDKEIGKVTDDSLHNEDDGMEIEGLKCTVHDTDKFIKAHSSKEEFKPIIEALNKLITPPAEQEPWKQESQALPNRFYVIPKRLKEVTNNGRVYEELPSYYVNGRWCEDPEGKVERSYYDDLRPEVIKEYRRKGIIR